jgi:uncharacterized protein YaeQ
VALKATIFKAELSISDMDRHYYQEHQLTLAQHPSETDERMMVRLVAFALNASERLEFTKGLSADDEPELWQKNYSDEIELWIDLGQPDEKRIRKACGRAKQVILYCYSHRSAQVWWEQNRNILQRFENLKIIKLGEGVAESLAQLTERTMRLQCTIQDGDCWITNNKDTVQIDMTVWKN